MSEAVQEERKRCPGTTDDGPCRVPSEFLMDDGWCLQHSPDAENKALADAARTKAGLVTKARHGKGINLNLLPPLDSPQAAAEWAEVVGRALASGLISASKAQALARLLSEWRSAHQEGRVAERLEELERRVRVRAVKP